MHFDTLKRIENRVFDRDRSEFWKISPGDYFSAGIEFFLRFAFFGLKVDQDFEFLIRATAFVERWQELLNDALLERAWLRGPALGWLGRAS